MSPTHIALILDGNRRYARASAKPESEGHKAGAKNFEDMCKVLREKGFTQISAFLLSTENMQRSKSELAELYSLFKTYVDKIVKDSKDEVRINVVGDRSLFPADVVKKINEVEQATKNYTKYTLNLLFGYGSRREIVTAVNRLLRSGATSVTEDAFAQSLWLTSEPDLVIRTGGEVRLSNFLL
ncbi:MAG TPA: polyprenyl diphosphate synthase, partial [Acidobacteriota bacterium]|nr:polyprenyl diphosphate synthase [Acidobacteriota bacterium]